MPLPAPDPTVLHPIAGQRRVVVVRPLVRSANVEAGEYTYTDCEHGDPLAFERDAVLYAFGQNGSSSAVSVRSRRACDFSYRARITRTGSFDVSVRRLRSAVGRRR
jgi:hypothetical protein